MAVREAVIVLGDPISTTTCRRCGSWATVHAVTRLTADGVTSRPPVTICTSPDCEVWAAVG